MKSEEEKKARRREEQKKEDDGRDSVRRKKVQLREKVAKLRNTGVLRCPKHITFKPLLGIRSRFAWHRKEWCALSHLRKT